MMTTPATAIRDEIRELIEVQIQTFDLPATLETDKVLSGLAARASQRKLTSLLFDAAGFGHGKPIARDASKRFAMSTGKNPEDLHEQRSAA